jgi:hypothetical protein
MQPFASQRTGQCVRHHLLKLSLQKKEGPELLSLQTTTRDLLIRQNAYLKTEHHDDLSKAALVYGNFSVNQVESAFMPLRSMLLPSHTANAMGTDAPPLN